MKYFYYLIHIFSSKFVCLIFTVRYQYCTHLYRCWQGCGSGSFYIQDFLWGPSSLFYFLPVTIHSSIFVFISGMGLQRLHDFITVAYDYLTPLLQFREVSGRSAGHVDELRGAAAGRPRRLRHAGLPHLLPLLTIQRDHRQQAVRHVAR
jgi:hypothetical protein